MEDASAESVGIKSTLGRGAYTRSSCSGDTCTRASICFIGACIEAGTCSNGTYI